MFGYVTPFKDGLTEDEYGVFTAYYCGLCAETGRRASQLARLGLSYDVTFLAIVLSSVLSDVSVCRVGRCIAHPFKKRHRVTRDPALSYAAEIGVILSYLKLADDWRDERSLKGLLGMGMLFLGCLRVRRHHAAETAFIKKQLDELSGLERDKCPSVDKTADAFAKITETLFSPEFIKSDGDRRALAWFGYNLGRWIYILDAVDDFDRDLDSGAYNPFIAAGCRSKADCAEKIELSLTFTLENIASAFELTDFKKNKSIVGKIVYMTLKRRQLLILSDAGRRFGRGKEAS